jgi:hypothetical protein
MKVLMEKLSAGRKFAGVTQMELIDTALTKEQRDELLNEGSVTAKVGDVTYRFTTDEGGRTNVWKLLQESLAKAGLRK